VIRIDKRLTAILIVVAVIIALAVVIIAGLAVREIARAKYILKVPYVQQEPRQDTKSEGQDWARAQPLMLPVKNGPEMEIKAVYTKDKIFFRIRYKDSTEDKIHEPWTFDGQSWRRGSRKTDALVLFLEIGDTINNFESKGFGVMDSGFDKTNEIYDFRQTVKRQKKGDWPGYKGRADVWIMGAGYTSPFGRADDAYFGADPNYTANQPGLEARLKTQWDEFTTPGVVKLNTVFWQQSIMASQGEKPTDTTIKDKPYLMYIDKDMNLENTPYPLENQLTLIPGDAVFKEGDQLPLLYFSSDSPGNWGGSRDDVAGKMNWQDGWWTVAMSRKLKTGHIRDIVFTPDTAQTVNFGVVVRTDGKSSRYSLPAILEFAPKGGS
jgi:hypothetical protein